MAEKWLASQAGQNANSRYAPRASHDSFADDEGRNQAALRRSANRRHALSAVPSSEPISPERSSAAFRSGNERLYEAYNDLHSLAQDFEKPFDAPAILVIGHQTDGKSGAPADAPETSPASWQEITSI